MTIENVPLELIDDNPFQSRSVYHQKDVNDLAKSIETHGLLQIPPGRHQDGRVELGFGHLRRRAFVKLAKKDPKKWGTMPIDIKELTDEQMAIFSLEENIKRSDITPIEVARAVEKYLVTFTDTTEQELAERLNMTQPNISNMRRVLRLPAKILEKVDEGRINFTMARELLIFQDLNVGEYSEWSRKEQKSVTKPKDGEYLMLEAIKGIRTESNQYGEPCTVDGIQISIHSVARRNMKALDRGLAYSYYDAEPYFDTREAGCLKCPKMIRTRLTKSQAAHWCVNFKCWEKHQKAHKDREAAQAREKMRQDVLQKIAAAEVKREENISQEISAEAPVEGVLTEKELDAYAAALREEAREKEDERRRVESVKSLPEDYPCHGCINVARCDRTTLVAQDGGGYICENRVTRETQKEVKQKATVEIPAEIRALIEEKAGTRAEVLDLNELWVGGYRSEMKQGYNQLDGLLDRIHDPNECLERCTEGFHYAFDSRYRDPRWGESPGKVHYVCTNPKCLTQKKAAYTRAKNAQGQAKKKAEADAIKKAVDQTTSLDHARMKLIVQAQLEGRHSKGYSWTEFRPRAWWNKAVGLGEKESHEIKEVDIYQAMDKLSENDLAKLIVMFMFASLTYSGGVETYRIETTQALNWMGIGVNVND